MEAGRFFQELNETLSELSLLRQVSKADDPIINASLNNLRLIIKDISEDFEDEKTLKEVVVKNTIRSDPSLRGSAQYHQSLEWIKRYLALRSELEQQFKSNSELRYVFSAFFADQVARTYEE